MSLDADKGRVISLSFKRASLGLTPAEERELEELRHKIALAEAASGPSN